MNLLGAEKLLEHLFLLEVLVEKVILKDKRCGKLCSCKHAVSHKENLPIRVRIKFINFPCFEINQEDFGLDEEKLQDLKASGNFKNGKSCLFPMAPLDLVRAIKLYPLAVTVFQREREMSTADVLGMGRVVLSQGMSDAVRRATECREDLPLSCTLTGSFPLINPRGKDAGRIKLFVRLSCFGQSIVTQFQLVAEDNSFLFKNSRADTAFQCKKCVMPRESDCPLYNDVLPTRPFLCSSEENFLEAVSRMNGQQMNPRAVAASCDCDVYKQHAVLLKEPEPPSAPPEEALEVDSPPEVTPRREWLPELAPQTPPVRYDTTGALSPAFEGRGPMYASHPPVRYDTTGALSPAYQDVSRQEWPPHPVVRYDTTSALSPAFEGRAPRYGEVPQHPPVRYDTTGALSAAHLHPAVRYDTTSSLSPAFQSTLQGPEPEAIPSTLSQLAATISEQVLTEEQLLSPVPAAVPVPVARPQQPPNQQLLTNDQSMPLYENIPDFSILKDKQEAAPAGKMKKKKIRKIPCPILQYPTVRRGHKHCLQHFPYVPKRMGWLWNVSNTGLKFRPGWRPGAVTRTVSRMIQHNNKAAGLRTESETKVRRRKLHAQGSTQSIDRGLDSMRILPPTLVVQRHHGEYIITMKPLPGRDANAQTAEPIELRVPEKPCTCDDSQSSQSELQIEFLAPGAFPLSKRQPVLKNRETQVYIEEPPAPVETPLPTVGSKKKKKPKKGKKSPTAPASDLPTEDKEIQPAGGPNGI